jgi:copper chaperone
MATTIVKVGGMTCQGCVKSVTRVLQDLPGISRAEVSLERGEASIVYDEATASRKAMLSAIDAAGFEAS